MLTAYRPEGAPCWAQGTHYQRLGLETLSSHSSYTACAAISLEGRRWIRSWNKKLWKRRAEIPFSLRRCEGAAGSRGYCERKVIDTIANNPSTM